MAIEAKEWIKASRRVHRANGTPTGGVWLHIDAGTLEDALKLARIPINAKLKFKRHSTAHKKEIAMIMITIKEDKT